MKQVTTSALAGLYMSILSANAGDLPHEHGFTIVHSNALREARQLLIVTTPSWSATSGTMSMFERDATYAPWHSRRIRISIVVGKAGLGWGRGVAYGERTSEPNKKEGDNKAPAGIFVLHGVFGYAPKAPSKMQYLALSPNILGIDDPQSRYYNQLIDQSKIDNRDWRTAEEMFRKDDLYKWGVVVDHNVPPQPGAGSCIFLHIWRGPGTSTVGCTAMAEKDMLDVIRWLDPAFAPLLVQLPRPVYDERRANWNLPPLR
jgi:D-alanyl-D-alanine dipeptidase